MATTTEILAMRETNEPEWRSRVNALRHEAAQAGDEKQVEVCLAALDGDHHAQRECARVLADVEAQS